VATSETNELGNGREDGRGAAIGQERNGRAESKKFYAKWDFNPGDRRSNRRGDRCSFDFAVGDGDNRAIVVVDRNLAIVQPRVERRGVGAGGD
jgi:hypothetical protein